MTTDVLQPALNYKFLLTAHRSMERLYNELICVTWNQEDRSRLQRGYDTSVHALTAWDKGRRPVPIETVKDAVVAFALVILGVAQRSLRFYTYIEVELRKRLIPPPLELCLMERVFQQFMASGLQNVSGRVRYALIDLECLNRQVFWRLDEDQRLRPAFPTHVGTYSPLTCMLMGRQREREAAMLRLMEHEEEPAPEAAAEAAEILQPPEMVFVAEVGKKKEEPEGAGPRAPLFHFTVTAKPPQPQPPSLAPSPATAAAASQDRVIPPTVVWRDGVMPSEEEEAISQEQYFSTVPLRSLIFRPEGRVLFHRLRQTAAVPTHVRPYFTSEVAGPPP